MILSVFLILVAASPPANPKVPDWRSADARGRPFQAEFYHGYADCVLNAWSDKAETLLQAVPESPDQAEAAKALQDAGCLHSGTIRMLAYELRGAIAETLYKRGRFPAGFTAPVPPGQSYEQFSTILRAGRASNQIGPLTKGIMLKRWFGYCAVERNRPAVENLIATKPHTKSEVKALEALTPALAACSPYGRRLRATVPEVRALMVEPLYWRRAAEGERR